MPNDIRSRVVNLKSTSNKKKKDISKLIEEAKKNAKKESEIFLKAKDDIYNALKDTALYAPLLEPLIEILDVNQHLISSVINGKNNVGMPDEDFLECRQEFFKVLINKYSKE